MTKRDLIAAIAADAGISNAAAARALQATMDAVVGALKKGDTVGITGFGTFRVSQRSARTGVNPRTGEKIKIKASKAPAFKAGKNFKEAINK